MPVHGIGQDNSQSIFELTPFSLAAVISFCLALLNWVWLAWRFRETLPPNKRGQENEQPRPAIFQLNRVSNLAVKKTCLSYLCYMVSFSGMEFTLTFLAVELRIPTQRHNRNVLIDRLHTDFWRKVFSYADLLAK